MSRQSPLAYMAKKDGKKKEDFEVEFTDAQQIQNTFRSGGLQSERRANNL